jgi:PPOX class probable F420-dependent enzyme
VDPAAALDRLRSARVGRMATVRPDGRPHVVPFVFALVQDGAAVRAYWLVDDKPKRTRSIQRLRNLEANASVEIVVDEFDEDWGRLWWVRASGTGRVVTEPRERARAIEALGSKYPAYRREELDGPVVAIDIETIAGWEASGG